MPSTPATRASIPPLHAINARHCGRQFSSHAINARHRGRLFHHCMPSTPAAAGVNPPRMPSTPATAGVYSPIACHQRPPPRASIPPRQIYHICRRQMSIPPRHLWRGGGRQAGGEVQNTNQAPPKTKKARHKGGLRNSIISFQWHLIRSKDKTMN